MTGSPRLDPELVKIIEAVVGEEGRAGPESDQHADGNVTVDEVERQLAVRLPPTIRALLERYGQARGGPLQLFSPAEIIAETRRLREIDEGFPLVLCSLFRDTQSGHVACIVAAGGERDELVAVDGAEAREVMVLAQSSNDALKYRLAQVIEHQHFLAGVANFIEHAARLNSKYGYDRQGSGRLAPDRAWRPYRSCVQDVIVGATVVRYQPAGNLIEVDVFLTAEIAELEPLTGARALATFLLGEAVRCGTTMEIRFTSNVEGGSVPLALRALAESVGTRGGEVRADAIAPKESSELSLRLAGYGATRSTRAEALIRNGQLRPEQIAYAVHEGSWTPAELEILMLAPDPLQLLVGASPWERLVCATGEVYARGAVLLGHLLRSLATPAPKPDDGATASEAQASEETEDRTIPLETDVDAAGLAASVQAVRQGDTFSVPWRADGDRLDTSRLYVALRPLGVVAMEHQLSEEIDECAERLDTPRAVLVPYDFWLLSAEARRALSDRARDRDVMILVGESRLEDIDIDVQRRQKRVGSRLQP